MRHYFLTGILILVFPLTLSAQRTCKVSGEYTYHVPGHVSIEEAHATAVERAKMQALADEFGTFVAEHTSVWQQYSNGSSETDFLSLGECVVRGEWLKDLDEPEIKDNFADGIFYVTARVRGKAREIVGAPIAFDAKVLRRADDRHEPDIFYDGDDIFLSFRSPADGYLAVYLMDEQGEAFRYLPYGTDGSGSFPVKANKPYTLFSRQHGENGPDCVEYYLTCDKATEQNMLYIVFSPNKFWIAIDEDHQTGMPRQQSFRDFQKWLSHCRANDKDMQLVVKPIMIKKP